MAQVAMSETAYEKLDALTQEAFGTWQAAHPEMTDELDALEAWLKETVPGAELVVNTHPYAGGVGTWVNLPDETGTLWTSMVPRWMHSLAQGHLRSFSKRPGCTCRD
jgi:hypothetical protein